MSSNLQALFCVICISFGQILFKFTALSHEITGSYWKPKTACWLFSSLFLYSLATFGWINLLKNSSLSRLYPWMVLAFVFVPLISSVLFNERLNNGYWTGIAIIVAGLFVVLKK